MPSDTVACFVRGTLISTAGGDLPVEDLREGELALTVSGAYRPIRWIGRRSYDRRFIAGNKDAHPIRLRAGALADGLPVRDLWLSSQHALYLDNVLVPVGKLVNHVSITQPEMLEGVDYVHLELDTHDIILAEGVAAETFIDLDSRNIFQNTTSHDDVRTHQTEYAPRVENGPILDAVRHRLDTRAGLYDAFANPGPLHGFLDAASPTRIAGWAQDLAHPEIPVSLTLCAGGVPVAEFLANQFRADLQAAGLGSGYHAFEYIPQTRLDDRSRLPLTLHRTSDGAQLPDIMSRVA